MSIFGGGELSRYGVHIIGAAVCGDAPDRCELDRPRGAADNQIARVHFVNAAAHKATLCHTGQKTDQDCGGREGLFLAGRGYGAGQALALHAEQCVILPEQGDLTGKKGGTLPVLVVGQYRLPRALTGLGGDESALEIDSLQA